MSARLAPPPEDAEPLPPRAPKLGTLGLADRGTLLGMALGVGLILQPWWSGGLALGFFLTLGATLLQILVSHLK